MAAGSDAPQPKPTTWYQYLVAYPTLLLALGSSLGAGLPIVWKEFVAWRKGVASSQLQVLKEQEQLWTKNLGCRGHAKTWEHDLPGDGTLALSLCPSGDLLLSWTYPDGSQHGQYRWVPRPK